MRRQATAGRILELQTAPKETQKCLQTSVIYACLDVPLRAPLFKPDGRASGSHKSRGGCANLQSEASNANSVPNNPWH